MEPLLDSRFRTWAAGDTYLVYPGARSCIRLERLIEGVQAHEKINILRQEFEKKGNKAGLKKIEENACSVQSGRYAGDSGSSHREPGESDIELILRMRSLFTIGRFTVDILL